MTSTIPIVAKTPLDPARLLHHLEAAKGQVRRAKKLADKLGAAPEEITAVALRLVAAGKPVCVRTRRDGSPYYYSPDGEPWPHGWEYGEVTLLYGHEAQLAEFLEFVCSKIRRVEEVRLRHNVQRLSNSSQEIANGLDEHLAHYTDLRLGIEMALGLITPPSP